MAGHSKWANIKHKKAANDKKRAKTWTKIIREITVAAREGDTSDPAAFPRLRLAFDKALAANMPKDTIERAAKRGAGETDGANYEEVRYEGYGPGGIAVLVDCMTDNRNRTVSEVRHAFSKRGGNLGTDGSVAYMFQHVGQILFEAGRDEEAIMDIALENGAEDVLVEDDGAIEVLTPIDRYQAVIDAFNAVSLVPENAEITMRADNLTALDVETAEKLMGLVDMLEDLDDVQEVYSNADISDDILAALD